MKSRNQCLCSLCIAKSLNTTYVYVYSGIKVEKEDPPKIIVDLDGTVFRVDKRLEMSKKMARSKQEFWEYFQSEKFMHLDEPNEKVIQLIQKYWSEGVQIVIITGRLKDKQEKYTYIQLATYYVPWSRIIFREGNDFSKDYEFKGRELKKLSNVLFVVDDSEEVRRVATQLGIKAIDPNLL